MPAYGILRNSVIRFYVCRAQSKKCRFKFNPQMPLFIFGEKSRILTWKYMRPAPIAAIYLSYLGYLPMTYRVLFSCAVRGRKIPFLWPDLSWLYLIFFCKLYCLPLLRRHPSHAIRIVWKRQDWTGNSLPIHVRIVFYTWIFCLPFRDLNSIVIRILSSPIPYIRFLRQRKLSNTVCHHRRCFRTWTVSLSGLLPVLPLSGAENYLLW